MIKIFAKILGVDTENLFTPMTEKQEILIEDLYDEINMLVDDCNLSEKETDEILNMLEDNMDAWDKTDKSMSQASITIDMLLSWKKNLRKHL